MKDNQNKQGIPSPEQRPDLYDDYDGIDRPEGWENPVKAPDRIQKLIDERKAATEKGGEAKVGTKNPVPVKE